MFLDVRFAKTRPFSFKRIFFFDDASFLDTLEDIDTLRERFVSCLENERSDHIVRSVEAYLPRLLGFLSFLHTNRRDVLVLAPIEICWTSGILAVESEIEWFSVESLQFDFVMCLYTLAYAHMRAAKECIGKTQSVEVFLESSKQVAKTLQLASGIFRYLGDEELTQYYKLPEHRPLEINAHAAIALSRACLGQAQEIILRRVELEGKGDRLSARVSLPLIDVFREMHEELAQLTGEEHRSVDIRIALKALNASNFYVVKANHIISRILYDSRIVGKAIHMLRQGIEFAKKLSFPESEPDEDMQFNLRQLLNLITNDLAEYEDSNSVVYHQDVEAPLLSEIPEPSLIAKSAPFCIDPIEISLSGTKLRDDQKPNLVQTTSLNPSTAGNPILGTGNTLSVSSSPDVSSSNSASTVPSNVSMGDEKKKVSSTGDIDSKMPSSGMFSSIADALGLSKLSLWSSSSTERSTNSPAETASVKKGDDHQNFEAF